MSEQTPSRAPSAHAYLSTACHHERHGECRRVCKFCPAKCSCDCHDVTCGLDHQELPDA